MSSYYCFLNIDSINLLNAINESYESGDTVKIQDKDLTIELDFWGQDVTLDVSWMNNDDCDGGFEVELAENEINHENLQNIIDRAHDRLSTENCFDIYEYYVPKHFEPYLTYGCADNLTDEEIEALDHFCDDLPGIGHFDFKEDLGFKSGDISDIQPCLACDMKLYEFLVKKGQ